VPAYDSPLLLALQVQVDALELENWFKVAASAPGGAKAGSGGAAGDDSDAGAAGGAAKRKGPVLLLEAKRQQNAGIALARLRMKNAEVRDAVLAADLRTLSAERLAILTNIVPTGEELTMLKEWEGDRATLGNLEQFFLAVADIPRYEQRLIAMAFSHRMEAAAGELRAKLGLIQRGVRAIRASAALRALLELLLWLGNYLNGDNAARGGAYGFKLDTLKKLTTVKTTDNKLTLLDYVAHVARKAGSPYSALLQLPADLALLADARAESLEAVSCALVGAPAAEDTGGCRMPPAASRAIQAPGFPCSRSFRLT
jgi:hypothetical protein